MLGKVAISGLKELLVHCRIPNLKSKVVLSQLPKCAAHAFSLSFGAMPARGHACPASTGGTEASASDLRL